MLDSHSQFPEQKYFNEILHAVRMASLLIFINIIQHYKNDKIYLAFY